MALGATVRPWKEVVGWKPWAVATKSAPYNAVERITMLTLNSEADPQLSLCLETAYIKFSAGGRRVDAELEYLEKLKQRRSGNFPRTLYEVLFTIIPQFRIKCYSIMTDFGQSAMLNKL